MAMMLIDQIKDSDCKTAEADAIRAKTGGSAQLTYDWANNKGFADAIAAIPSGCVNFTIVTGEKPTNPAENTIWLDTATDYTMYAISVDSPTNPAAGDIWISVGLASAVAFSVSTENIVMVYPVTAYQWSGSAWTVVIAQSYQGGVWKDWTYWLYFEGNQMSSITGGWEVTQGPGYASLQTDKMQFTGLATICTSGAIDVTNFSTLNMSGNVSAHSSNGNTRIGYASSKISNDGQFTAYARRDTTGDFTISLDISGVQGNVYIAVTNYQQTASIYRVWLE